MSRTTLQRCIRANLTGADLRGTDLSGGGIGDESLWACRAGHLFDGEPPGGWSARCWCGQPPGVVMCDDPPDPTRWTRWQGCLSMITRTLQWWRRLRLLGPREVRDE